MSDEVAAEADSSQEKVSTPKNIEDVFYGNDGDQEPEKPKEAVSKKGEEDEPTEADAEKAKDEKPKRTRRTNKDKFIFDKEKYKKQGIEDPALLKVLEDKDRELHKQKVTIGKQGHQNKDTTDKLSQLKKELGDLEGKTKDLSDDELDEMSNSEAIKRSEEIRKSKDLEADKMREMRITRNEALLPEGLEVGDFSGAFEAYISDDIAMLGGTREDTESFISSFKKDPLGSINPEIFHNLVQRHQLQADLEDANIEIDELKATVEKLSSELKGKPKKVLDQMKKASQSAHNVGATAGGYSSTNEKEPIENLFYN